MATLTDKEELFCYEFIKDFNATKAYIRAGYDKKSANSNAYGTLRRDDVRAKIDELIAERKDLLPVDVYFIIEKLLKVVDYNLAEVEIFFKGIPTGQYKMRDANAALKALELLGKYKGVFEVRNNSDETKDPEINTIENLNDGKI